MSSPNHESALRLTALAILLSTSACKSGGEEAGADEADEGSDDATGTDGTDGGELPDASQPRVRRMSNHELGNALDSLTGVRPAALDQLPPDQRTFVFDRMAAAQTISPVHLDALAAVADDIHEALLAEQRLDELAAACSDDLLPPAIAETHTRVAGVALLAEPDWAACPLNCNIGDPLAEDAVYLLYASPDEGAVSHLFEVPAEGRYTLTLRIQTAEAMTISVLSDMVEIASWPVADDGQAPIELTTTQTFAAGGHDLRFQFSSNNEVIHVFDLTIDGPLDEVDAPAERRACAQALIDEFGPLAYRRPLTADEHDRLLVVYDMGVADGSFHDASRMLFEAMLGSPHFLYLVEVGTPDDARPGWYRLDDWELATRLSYSLCEQPPDAELRSAAAAGELNTPEQVRAQALRLLDEPCGRETVARFYRQWLELEQLVSLARDPAVYPDYVAATMPGAMLREADRFLAELTWNEDATIADLYAADHTWVDATGAALYGLEVAGDELVRVELPPERLGLLTLPGVLTVTSKFSQTSPVYRGAFVIRELLCGTLASPPGNVDVTPPALDPSLTTRERWAAHSSDPACSGCHARLDPVGFALEEFDAIGRHRTEEYGKPIDASGGLPDLGAADGSLVGGVALAELIADSDEAATCFARQWFRFAGARTEQGGSIDDETLALIRGLDDDPNSIRAALLAYVEAESFYFRIVPEEMAP
ncbi:DUF1592 domain-containing protein [Nannocystaceae bacterium ST9]